jgi:heavy metal sensor kinase
MDRFLADETRELIGYFYDYDFFQDIESIKKRFDKEMFIRKSYPFYCRILNAEGKVIVASEGTPSIKTPFDEIILKKARREKVTTYNVLLTDQRYAHRLRSTPIFISSNLIYIVQIATYLKSMQKTLENFRANILLAILISLILGSFGGWFLARRGLSPIAAIIKSTNKITATSLKQRLSDPHSGDEIDHLVSTINNMVNRLENSFKKMSQFTADVSHELRSPLCSLKGETEVILSQERSAEEYRNVLINNLETFGSLNKVIDDLLLLSKADSGDVPLDLVTLRLDKLLSNLYDLFKVLADQKNITFPTPQMETVEIKGDKTKLQQLFSNLIDNAIKYTPSGGKINLSLEYHSHQAEVTVKDSGIGIIESELPHIFDRFYRVEKSRSKATGGTGLGLSICKWIVEAHQGKIKAESEPGKGSIFTIILPIQQSP